MSSPASAIDSVSGGEPESLSAEEFEEVRAWVYENHAGWDKSIEIKPDGTYVWTSCVGESTPEIMRGTGFLGQHADEVYKMSLITACQS